MIIGVRFFMNLIRPIKKRINSWALSRKHRPTLELNTHLLNQYLGQRCFIVGNGPSIKDQDLTRLKNEETFVVNTFWNHLQYQTINPKNYVLVDAEFFPTDEKPHNFWSLDLVNKKEILKSCPTRLFFNINGKNFVEKNELFPDNPLHHLFFDGLFDERLKFNLDINGPVPTPKNVIIAALMCAIYMGFEEIYLLGCEHDFLAHLNYFEGFKHFHETQKYDPTNEKQAKYFALPTNSYEAFIHHTKILFQNYRLLKIKTARTHPGVRIYNATPNSFLDVFPRVKFEDIKI